MCFLNFWDWDKARKQQHQLALDRTQKNEDSRGSLIMNDNDNDNYIYYHKGTTESLATDSKETVNSVP